MNVILQYCTLSDFNDYKYSMMLVIKDNKEGCGIKPQEHTAERSEKVINKSA